MLRRYGFGFVARGRRERVFEFTFFDFFEKIRRLKLFFSLLVGRVREKGLFLLSSNASLFRAWGMFWRRFRDHQTRKKRFPAMSFSWFERCLDENCAQTSRKIGCLRALAGIAAGAIFSLSRFWIWAKIFFFVGVVTRIRRGISLASSSRVTHTDTSSFSFTLYTHTRLGGKFIYNQQSRDRQRSNSAWKKPRRKPLMSLYWTGRWCGWR